MARQFYGALAVKEGVTITFSKPVRKAVFMAEGGVRVWIGTETLSGYQFPVTSTPLYVDFQSVNCGFGVKKLTVKGENVPFYVSVSEYANDTAGNDNYYI